MTPEDRNDLIKYRLNFDKEFVKTGIFDKNLSKIVHNAYNLRLKYDYQDFIDPSREFSTEQLQLAKLLVDNIRTYLEKMLVI